ncbi:MAG TPA: hypothetical protein QF762_05480 [Acidimicrobiales bacterium]|jgi:arsenate reductase-like glutaredoxin family protein|nr:hypothetical protein [Acidimicrobiales bacterium]
MKEPPTAETLHRIADGFEGPVEDLVRKDSQFKKLELNEQDYVDDPSAVVELLSQKKVLIQRPILVYGDLSKNKKITACVGRPKEKIYEFFGQDD